MLQGCNELISLDLSNFNTSNVTDVSFMFNECYELTEIKGIHNFNTNQIINIDKIFCNCNSLIKSFISI